MPGHSGRTVRIGSGLGYWGDDTSAPGRQIRDSAIDYLVMDFLAEVTMSILQKQKQKDPERGYAGDIIRILRDALPDAVRRGVKIICNAGGVNPLACARAVRALTQELGLDDQVKIAAIVGDDLFGRVDELRGAGVTLENMETGEPFELVADRLVCANAYVGAAPIVEALEQGATIVIGGRLADPSLTLGPLMYEHGWTVQQHDHLAAGIVAGHLIECGAHSTGGNHQAGWQDVPDMGDIGFPVVEVDGSGRIVMSKTPGSGGLVSRETVIEQLVYEIGDPKAYLTPDVAVDFTTLTVEDLGGDHVEVTGATGRPRPETLKISAAYRDGFAANTMYLYSAPHAKQRAEKAKEILDHRIGRLGLALDEIRSDLIGLGAVHERRTPRIVSDPCEVVLRYAVRSQSRAAVERAFVEASTVFHGPPGKTNLISGRPRVSEVLSYWPTLVPGKHVETKVFMT
ncbi:DUF1446 domain-containing protein [Amycolatopsis acidicola]|uniref:DUF1446 domain-containing protein n=1 Tax=Amycolatopsis acidicola TaxID=2596893 RepID=A0A5N0VCF9_9PSEU|nr:acyclic terpene utilization AtuA family protein [Amycolatopsis acidicola]KAA9164059.1 DUF1446 domain-containing protein [Amycolatopsis acidicola]